MLDTEHVAAMIGQQTAVSLSRRQALSAAAATANIFALRRYGVLLRPTSRHPIRRVCHADAVGACADDACWDSGQRVHARRPAGQFDDAAAVVAGD
jgi:hypothetical protein